MQDELPEIDRPGGNRLHQYDIAEWLRYLVKIKAVRRDSVAGISQGIRARIERGDVPWEESEN